MDFTVLKQSRLIHMCFALTFFTSGVIVNLVQCLFYLLLRPFNKRLYRKINYYFCFTIYSQVVFLADWWSGSSVRLYADPDEFKKYMGKEHSCCVMNHSYEIDWIVGWMVTDRLQCLGNCKAYAKKVIQYIPVLGWGWKCAEFVFLERSFDKDKDTISKQIKKLADHPDPIWLLLFPEGTRFTAQKHKASLEFARQKNLPELKHHLLPRTKGFTASLPPMYGKIPALYDLEIAFKEDDSEYRPTVTNLLLGRPVTAHMYMKRYPIEDLPRSEEEQEVFLRDLFKQKDKLRDSFLKTGDFFATSGVPRFEPIVLERRYNSIFNIIFWVVTVLVPIIYYLIKLVFAGDVVKLSIAFGIITALYVLMQKTIGMSEIKQASSYGTITQNTEGLNNSK